VAVSEFAGDIIESSGVKGGFVVRVLIANPGPTEGQ